VVWRLDRLGRNLADLVRLVAELEIRRIHFESLTKKIETRSPEAAKQAGCFSLADLQKKGDTYSGTNKDSCVCQYQKRRGRSAFFDTITNRYTNEWPIEITKLTPTRIEGIGTGEPQDAKFNCEKRTYSKPPVQIPFVWIPE